jgi:hypothetical protein
MSERRPGNAVDLANNVTVRFYQDGDEGKLLALLEAAFGRWPRVDVAVAPVDHLRWKLRSGDASLGLHTIAEADSEMIGAWLVDIQDFKVGGRILTCRRGMDTCVHPDHRAAGVMTQMRELTREDFNRAVDFRLGGQTRHAGQLRLVKREPYEMLGNTIQDRGGPRRIGPPRAKRPVRRTRSRPELDREGPRRL